MLKSSGKQGSVTGGLTEEKPAAGALKTEMQGGLFHLSFRQTTYSLHKCICFLELLGQGAQTGWL